MLEIFIAFYATGVAIAMYRLYYPSYRVIKALAPSNSMVQKPILSATIVLLIFTIMLPFIAYIILFDDKMDRFVNGFVKGVMGVKDDRR